LPLSFDGLVGKGGDRTASERPTLGSQSEGTGDCGIAGVFKEARCVGGARCGNKSAEGTTTLKPIPFLRVSCTWSRSRYTRRFQVRIREWGLWTNPRPLGGQRGGSLAAGNEIGEGRRGSSIAETLREMVGREWSAASQRQKSKTRRGMVRRINKCGRW